LLRTIDFAEHPLTARYNNNVAPAKDDWSNEKYKNRFRNGKRRKATNLYSLTVSGFYGSFFDARRRYAAIAPSFAIVRELLYSQAWSRYIKQ